ncbi:MAG: hypothetical protein CMF69_09625 [Magnetovibrio sp.]|nr:hypothetical protein [Magnetovibrio sp.]|tara:strand:+ start:976 stop:1887 length:912 start_codon:yes stop_codon:yes gene_type:complete
MTLRKVLIAICAGLASATAAVAFLSKSFIALGFVYLASLPILMVGLAYGMTSAILAAVVGALISGISGFPVMAGAFTIIYGLPALIIIRLQMMQHTVSAGNTLSIITMLTSGMVVTVAFFTWDIGLSKLITNHLEQVLKQLTPDFNTVGRSQLAQAMTPLFPGVVAINWIVMTVINTVFAQYILVRIGYNQHPTPAYVNLELPFWSSWPLVSAAALALAGTGEWEYIGRNLAMLFAVPYFFLGLSVFHYLARRVTATKAVLITLYLVIVISMWAALVVAAIGVVEQWFGLRDRFSSKSLTKDP